MMSLFYQQMNINGLLKKVKLQFCHSLDLIQVASLKTSSFFMNICFYISEICLTTVLISFCSLAAQSSRSNRKSAASIEDTEAESGRLVGTVRRHMPIDTREPIGAIIHFYVGDSFDSSR